MLLSPVSPAAPASPVSVVAGPSDPPSPSLSSVSTICVDIDEVSQGSPLQHLPRLGKRRHSIDEGEGRSVAPELRAAPPPPVAAMAALANVPRFSSLAHLLAGPGIPMPIPVVPPQAGWPPRASGMAPHRSPQPGFGQACLWKGAVLWLLNELQAAGVNPALVCPDRFRLLLADEGIGLPEQELKRILCELLDGPPPGSGSRAALHQAGHALLAMLNCHLTWKTDFTRKELGAMVPRFTQAVVYSAIARLIEVGVLHRPSPGCYVWTGVHLQPKDLWSAPVLCPRAPAVPRGRGRPSGDTR